MIDRVEFRKVFGLLIKTKLKRRDDFLWEWDRRLDLSKNLC